MMMLEMDISGIIIKRDNKIMRPALYEIGSRTLNIRMNQIKMCRGKMCHCYRTKNVFIIQVDMKRNQKIQNLWTLNDNERLKTKHEKKRHDPTENAINGRKW